MFASNKPLSLHGMTTVDSDMLYVGCQFGVNAREEASKSKLLTVRQRTILTKYDEVFEFKTSQHNDCTTAAQPKHKMHTGTVTQDGAR